MLEILYILTDSLIMDDLRASADDIEYGCVFTGEDMNDFKKMVCSEARGAARSQSGR